MTAALFAQGFKPVIYLSLNNTIRQDVITMFCKVNLIKMFISNFCHFSQTRIMLPQLKGLQGRQTEMGNVQ
jgi:hypothetical protein